MISIAKYINGDLFMYLYLLLKSRQLLKKKTDGLRALKNLVDAKGW